MSIDTSSLFPLPRLRSILSDDRSEESVTEALSRLHALSIRSLPSLLALLLHSADTDTSVFSRTPELSLLVIDDLSTPILGAYPPGFEDDMFRRKSGKKDYVNKDSVSIKRTNLLKELGNKLALLASKRDIAVIPRDVFISRKVLVLNQLTTKVISGSNALLVPALGDAWTSVCSFRVTLYRQRLQPNFCNRANDVRFAYFQKCEGMVVKDEEAMNVPFLITVYFPSALGLTIGSWNRRRGISTERNGSTKARPAR